jgi:hypothetical protein
MKSLSAKYYVQICTYVFMINNSISNYWMDNQGDYIAINGDKGFPVYWHWYVTFEVYIQPLLILALLVAYMVYPLTNELKKYAIATIIIYSTISIMECFIFQYTGSGYLGESFYLYFVVGYTALLLIFAIKLKVWNH